MTRNEAIAAHLIGILRTGIPRYLQNGGCSNCGGVPHTTTCMVGALAKCLEDFGQPESAEDPAALASPAPTPAMTVQLYPTAAAAPQFTGYVIPQSSNMSGNAATMFPDAPAPAAGQCAACGERDGAHGDWCHASACVNCGHGVAKHREGLAVRLLSDGFFHPCPGYEAEKSIRCSFVHAEGWTCGRAQGHTNVHVPPSRMAPAPAGEAERLRALAVKWRREADGVQQMHGFLQAERIRSCADELLAALTPKGGA